MTKKLPRLTELMAGSLSSEFPQTSNDLQIATEYNELMRKGPRKQSKIFSIPVSLI